MENKNTTSNPGEQDLSSQSKSQDDKINDIQVTVTGRNINMTAKQRLRSFLLTNYDKVLTYPG